MADYPLLPPATVRAAMPAAARLGVSAVARSERGFARWYVRGGAGDARAWLRRRRGFLARHVRQAVLHGEPLWRADGTPTRRHLALIMWAYSPQPAAVGRWLAPQRPVARNPTTWTRRPSCPA